MPIPSNAPGGPRQRTRLFLAATLAALALPLSASALDLSLSEALARAAAFDPAQITFGAQVEAAEASVRQANIKPMPTVGFDFENFTGTGPYALLDRSETTLSYALPLERAGKREARVGRARAEVEVVRARSMVVRLDLLRTVQAAYAEAITAQAEIARDQARDSVRVSRNALAAFWGGSADFTLKLDDFFNVTPVLERSDPSVSDLTLLEAERSLAIAAVAVEQSRNVADPTLRAGLRYFGQGGDAALVVGGSIPLGMRPANRGNVERALAERTAAEAKIAAAKVVQDREIVRLFARLRALTVESERIRAEVIPHAIRAVEQVTDGFNRGGFEYIDVTETQRALADARARRVEILREFHIGLATLDRLTGKHRALAAARSQEHR